MAATPRILVIDDEPPIRKLLRMGLSANGYQIIEAPNGRIALERLNEAPDLIILDLGLPDIQGLDLLRSIRGRNESVPIVVLSSRGDEAGKVYILTETGVGIGCELLISRSLALIQLCNTGREKSAGQPSDIS